MISYAWDKVHDTNGAKATKKKLKPCGLDSVSRSNTKFGHVLEKIKALEFSLRGVNDIKKRQKSQ